MRIGILLSSNSALHNPGDGRVSQAKNQAAALEALGHEVVRMDTWNTIEREKLDVLHVIEGGFGNYVLMPSRPRGYKRIVLAPFIDSNMPFWIYRMAAGAHVGSRLYSAQYVLRRQGLNADVTIAKSEHERERFVRGLGLPRERVKVVLNGVNPPKGVADGEGVRQRLGLPAKFVLTMGMYTDERKNAVRLARAARSLGYPLVLGGTAAPGPILNELQQMAKTPGVTLLKFLDRPTLEGLYAACEVFALPSTNEGTGLVALEAASYGAKVVITKNGGPPDYFGKWAEYVNPDSESDIAGALKRAWEKPRTDELKQFVLGERTWRHCAEQLVAVYEGIAESP